MVFFICLEYEFDQKKWLHSDVVFKDVLDSKNSAIKDLQYELARVCKVRWNEKYYSIQIHFQVLR